MSNGPPFHSFVASVETKASWDIRSIMNLLGNSPKTLYPTFDTYLHAVHENSPAIFARNVLELEFN